MRDFDARIGTLARGNVAGAIADAGGPSFAPPPRDKDLDRTLALICTLSLVSPFAARAQDAVRAERDEASRPTDVRVDEGAAPDARTERADAVARGGPADERAGEAESFDDWADDDLGEEDGDEYSIDGVVDRPIVGATFEDPTTATTTIEVSDRRIAGETLRDVLPEAPSTRVLSLGAEGQFSGVSLRGADLGHTEVFLGALPFAGVDQGAVDLSILPLAALGRIEVHRGAAPAWWGSQAVGGLIRLVPLVPEEDRLALTLGGGSFGRYRAAGTTALRRGPLSMVAAFGADGARNDFPYLDDGGTLFNPTDDATVRRRNAEFRRTHGLVRLRFDRAGHGAELLWLTSARDRGDPGRGHTPATEANSQLGHHWLALSYRYDGFYGDDARAYRLEAAAALSHQRHRYRDPFGEIGLGRQDADDRSLAGQLRVAGRVDLLSWLEGIVSVRGRVDRFDPDDEFAFPGDVPSTRRSLVSAAELRLHGSLRDAPVELRGSVTYLASRASLNENAFNRIETFDEREGTTTGRVAASVSPLAWLGLHASFNTAARLPTLFELFGDRARFTPNPELRPERSRGVELGATIRHCGDLGSAVVELRGFRREIDDVIRYQINPQRGTAVAVNDDATRARGMELGVQLDAFEHLRVAGSTHRLDTDSGSGRELPQRPRAVFHMRLEGRSGALGRHVEDIRVFAIADHQSSAFLDPANFVRLPARTFFDVGMSLRLAVGLELGATVRDVGDRAGFDYLAYPLPGRRAVVQLHYQRGF